MSDPVKSLAQMIEEEEVLKKTLKRNIVEPKKSGRSKLVTVSGRQGWFNFNVKPDVRKLRGGGTTKFYAFDTADGGRMFHRIEADRQGGRWEEGPNVENAKKNYTDYIKNPDLVNKAWGNDEVAEFIKGAAKANIPWEQFVKDIKKYNTNRQESGDLAEEGAGGGGGQQGKSLAQQIEDWEAKQGNLADMIYAWEQENPSIPTLAEGAHPDAVAVVNQMKGIEPEEKPTNDVDAIIEGRFEELSPNYPKEAPGVFKTFFNKGFAEPYYSFMAGAQGSTAGQFNALQQYAKHLEKMTGVEKKLGVEGGLFEDMAKLYIQNYELYRSKGIDPADGFIAEIARAFWEGAGALAIDLPMIIALGQWGLPIWTGLHGGAEAIEKGESALGGIAKGAAKGVALHTALKATSFMPTAERIAGGAAIFAGMTVAQKGDLSEVVASAMIGGGLALTGGRGQIRRSQYYENMRRSVGLEKPTDLALSKAEIKSLRDVFNQPELAEKSDVDFIKSLSKDKLQEIFRNESIPVPLRSKIRGIVNRAMGKPVHEGIDVLGKKPIPELDLEPDKPGEKAEAKKIEGKPGETLKEASDRIKSEMAAAKKEVVEKPELRSEPTKGEITVYRGEGPGTDTGNYYSIDKAFAKVFTRAGSYEQVIEEKIDISEVYESEKLPFAGNEKQIDGAILFAKEAGYKAILVDEGKDQPNSVFVFDKSIFIKPEKVEAAAPPSSKTPTEISLAKSKAAARPSKHKPFVVGDKVSFRPEKFKKDQIGKVTAVLPNNKVMIEGKYKMYQSELEVPAQIKGLRDYRDAFKDLTPEETKIAEKQSAEFDQLLLDESGKLFNEEEIDNLHGGIFKGTVGSRAIAIAQGRYKSKLRTMAEDVLGVKGLDNPVTRSESLAKIKQVIADAEQFEKDWIEAIDENEGKALEEFDKFLEEQINEETRLAKDQEQLAKAATEAEVKPVEEGAKLPSKEKAAVKPIDFERWNMAEVIKNTQEDWVGIMRNLDRMTPPEYKDWTKRIEEYKSVHKAYVKKALSEGKPVPAEVLKDYPDLKTADVELGFLGFTPQNMKLVYDGLIKTGNFVYKDLPLKLMIQGQKLGITKEKFGTRFKEYAEGTKRFTEKVQDWFRKVWEAIKAWHGKQAGFIKLGKKKKGLSQAEKDAMEPEFFAEARVHRLDDIYKNIKKGKKHVKLKDVVARQKEIKAAQVGVISKLLTPISTRLAIVNPKLKRRMRKHEYALNQQLLKDTNTALPWLEATKKMNKTDRAILDLAMKNADTITVEDLVKKYGIEKEHAQLRALLDKSFLRATEVGYDTNYLPSFYPRRVKDRDGFLSFLYEQEGWGAFQEAINAKEKALDRELLDDEKIHLINSLIRGYGNQLTLGKPGALKERIIDIIDEDLNKYYYDSNAALLSYLDMVNEAIAARNFFGIKASDKKIQKTKTKVIQEEIALVRNRLKIDYSPKNQATLLDLQDQLSQVKKTEKQKIDPINQLELIDDSIGKWVKELMDEKAIKPWNQQEIVGLLRSRFHYRVTTGGWQDFKNIGYLTTMAQFKSAITQIGDMVWSFHNAGFFKSHKHIIKSVFNKSNISRDDIGITRIAQEFSDVGKLSKAVNIMFKVIGLEKIDRIGKETLINSTIEDYRKLVKKKKPDWFKMRKLKDAFGEETDAVIADLKSGEITENVKYLAFYTLLDFQPVALMEMPQKYLDSPKGRVMYMLKTFDIKKFDVFRNEAIRLIRHGKTKKEKIRGYRNLIKLTALFVLANATADEIKDYMLGRETSLSDRTIDNVLRIFGVSKFIAWYVRRNGLVAGIYKLVVPPSPYVESPTRDAVEIHDAIKKGEFDDYKWKDMQTWKIIPLFGALYYWWFGGGVEKKESETKRREKAGALTLQELIMSEEPKEEPIERIKRAKRPKRKKRIKR